MGDFLRSGGKSKYLIKRINKGVMWVMRSLCVLIKVIFMGIDHMIFFLRSGTPFLDLGNTF